MAGKHATIGAWSPPYRKERHMTEAPEFNDGTQDEQTDEVAEFTAGVQSQDPSYQPDTAVEKGSDDERQY